MAIALVVGHHWWQFGDRGSGALPVAFFRRVGWAGVDLFFVLSGFLISGLIFREYQRHGEFRFGRFLWRRGLRIYPGFYALLIVSIVLYRPRADLIVHEAFFLQSYLQPMWNHTWSLAIEEHFYVGLGLLVALLARWPRVRVGWRAVVVGWAVVCVACLTARTAAYTWSGYGWDNIYARTHLRIDVLLLGVALAYLYHFHRADLLRVVERIRRPLLVASLALAGLPLVLDQSSLLMCSLGLVGLSAGWAGLLLLALTATPATHPLIAAPYAAVCRIGEYSYPMYLWHMVVLTEVRGAAARWELPLAAVLIAYVVGTVLVGVGAGRLVDAPILRLRDRYFPSRSGGGPVAGGEAASSAR